MLIQGNKSGCYDQSIKVGTNGLRFAHDSIWQLRLDLVLGAERIESEEKSNNLTKLMFIRMKEKEVGKTF